MLLLDWRAIDDDRLRDEIDTLQLVLTRATSRHISELIVGGRTVVKNGAVTGVDAQAARAELLGKLRAGMRVKAAIAAALPALERSHRQAFRAKSRLLLTTTV